MAESLHAQVLAALEALPPPVTEDAALAAAKGVLPRTEAAHFETWFKKNGATLLERFNGKP